MVDCSLQSDSFSSVPTKKEWEAELTWNVPRPRGTKPYVNKGTVFYMKAVRPLLLLGTGRGEREKWQVSKRSTVGDLNCLQGPHWNYGKVRN